MKIVSINLGTRGTIKVGKSETATGIDKAAVESTVQISEVGLEGDYIADLERHGGRDQAVYLYSMEDYTWWSVELDQELAPGMFGENITLSTFEADELRIGDRFKIGEVILEVTFGRVPCATFGAWMNDPTFVKRFVTANRPGVYTRVISEGTIQLNNTVELIPTAADAPTVGELFELFHTREKDVDLMRSALNFPIAERAVSAFKFWLDEVE